MKTFSLLLAAGGAAFAGTVAVAGPSSTDTHSGTAVVRIGSGDGAGLPGAPGGRAGAPGRVGGWSGGPAEREGLRSYCVGLLEAAPARSGAAGGFRPADCAGLFAAMARPDHPEDDEVPAPGAALARACAALLKPGAVPRPGEPEACSDYVANLDADAPRRAASGTGERAPDGPSVSGGVGGRGGRSGVGPGAGAGGAGGAGVGGGVGGAGGAGGTVR
ncbi:translational initiation factor [Methylobacterium frigidaeris]|uniref:Uncharacterized protein n=1 Tax=Methylobacterium frigidaeris TaxID=2038277 RepID=A0AA37M3J8_9HYPH|nr:translational initiation factor [Methylobacterium frigidaeris]GJD61462.1 hypothetical protein MPEAHAMD_1605 [Methylobacterium frigidaeris]